MTNQEVVEALLTPQAGVNVVQVVTEMLDRLGSTPTTSSVPNVLADNEAQHYSPDVEWDMSGANLGVPARGLRELALWWSVWIAIFETYEYTVDECGELGTDGWVLTVTTVSATARDGQSATMPVAQVWKVEDERVAVMRGFTERESAIAAAV